MAKQSPRIRRTTLAVPGSNTRMIEKSKTLGVDAIFLDLEDSVSALAKLQARENVVAALNTGGFGDRILSVRINDISTNWALEDLNQIMLNSGKNLDAIMLPKVSTEDDIKWLDSELSKLESKVGKPVGSTAIEVQIENAIGLINVEKIAASSKRVETIVLGPGDLIASLNMRTLEVGLQPSGYEEADAYHYILLKLLIAARAFDKQVIDGPYFNIADLAGLRLTANRSAALGFDGKWVLHPSQIEIVNEIFSPSQQNYDKAELILETYDYHTSKKGGMRGAVMLDGEMIDEASRKMAQIVASKGRAAGLKRTKFFTAGI